MKSLNVFEKEKKVCPFSSSKPRPKKGKKAFSCEAAADLTWSNKGSFFNQDEWLQEVEEHEQKPDTSEKFREKDLLLCNLELFLINP